MAQESEVEGGLDRPQQPVVVIAGGVPAGRDLRPDDDDGDVAAGGQTAAAAGLSTSAGAFVPGDDQAGVVLPGRGAGQLFVQGPQPIVPSPASSWPAGTTLAQRAGSSRMLAKYMNGSCFLA